MRLVQLRPTEPPFLHRSRTEVLDQNIGLRDELQEKLHPLFLAQIDRDRLPVSTFAEPCQGCVVTLRGRSEAPHWIARDGMLYLQDLGAKLAQD